MQIPKISDVIYIIIRKFKKAQISSLFFCRKIKTLSKVLIIIIEHKKRKKGRKKLEIKASIEKDNVIYTVRGNKDSISDFYYAINSASGYFSKVSPLSPGMKIIEYPIPERDSTKNHITFIVPNDHTFLYILERCGIQSMNRDLTAHKFYVSYKKAKQNELKQIKEKEEENYKRKQQEQEHIDKELADDLILLFPPQDNT